MTSKKRQKFVLYTNPNNVTNCAYAAIGAYDANEVLKNAKEFPDSYRVLHKGMGTDHGVQNMQRAFSNYRFV